MDSNGQLGENEREGQKLDKESPESNFLMFLFQEVKLFLE